MDALIKQITKRFSIAEILAILSIAALFLRGATLMGDPGVGWHLSSGKLILENWKIPKYDPFLFSDQPRLWLNNQWLSDLIFAVLYKIGGIQLLQSVVISIGWLIAFIIPIREFNREKLSEATNLIGSFTALVLLSIQWFLRPVIFSFLLFHFLFILLRRSKPSYWLIPFFTLWANLHPAFLLGLVLIFLKFVCELFEGLSERLWTKKNFKTPLILIGCGLATLINPYGLKLHFSAFGLLNDRYFQNLNLEWLAPGIGELSCMPFFITFFCCLYFLLSAAKNDRFTRLVLILFLSLALTSSRYIAFLALPAGIFIASNIQRIIDRKNLFPDGLFFRERCFYFPIFSSITVILFFLFALVLGHFPFKKSEDYLEAANFPKALSEKLSQCFEANGKVVFATPDYGGAITLLSEQKLKPLLDDRNELLGEAAYKDYFTIVSGAPGWESDLESLKADCLLIQKGMPLLEFLPQSLNWEAIPADDDLSLFVKRNRSS